MNTSQLYKCLADDGLLRRQCAGVYPSDKLPIPQGYPFSFIANTDVHTKPGTHWLAIYFDENGNTEFFDSYARKPDNHFIVKYLKRYGLNVTCTPHRVQAPFSSVCGQYCIYYLWHRLRGYTMEEILKNFSEDLQNNDKFVTAWLNDNFDIDTHVYELGFLINQSAVCCE